MSNTRPWTRGPWRVDLPLLVVSTGDKKRQAVAQIVLCKEFIPNETLIAAAPKLYEALEAIIMQPGSMNWIRLENADLAIAALNAANPQRSRESETSDAPAAQSGSKS